MGWWLVVRIGYRTAASSSAIQHTHFTSLTCPSASKYTHQLNTTGAPVLTHKERKQHFQVYNSTQVNRPQGSHHVGGAY
jgi:hypothetical protein